MIGRFDSEARTAGAGGGPRVRCMKALAATVVVVAGAALGCATAPEARDPLPPQIEGSLGDTLWPTFRQTTLDYLQGRGFHVEAEYGPPVPMLRTEWLVRPPTEDEREAGAVETRSRVVLRGAPVRGTDKFKFSGRVENQVREILAGEWKPRGATDQFEDYAWGILDGISQAIWGRDAGG